MRLVQAPRLADRASLRLPVRALAQEIFGQGVVHALLVTAAAAYVGAFAGTGLLRAIYPYPIDRLEHGALQEVRRVLTGQPIYVSPTLDYVPMIYGPLYFYLSAAVAGLTGSDLFGLRLLSLLASLGSIAIVVLLVRHETDSLAMGVVGGGLLAACAPLVEGAMDIGRTDATSLFFILGAIAATRVATLEPNSGWTMSALSGSLMGLALLTKQTGLPVAAALLVLFGYLRRDRLLAYGLTLGAVVGVGLLLLRLQTGPWAWFYLWELPRQHEVIKDLATRFWDHVVTRFAAPLMVGPFYLVERALVGDRKRLVFYATVALALVGMAWVSQSTIAAGRNVDLPAYAGIAILAALGLHEVVTRIPRLTSRARTMRAYVLAAAIGQFAVMVYNPRLVVPYRSDMWDGDRLSSTLAALPGPIFAGSYYGFLPKSSDAVAPDLAAVLEIEGEQVRSTPAGDRWNEDLAEAFNHKRFTYIIIDPDLNTFTVPDLAKAAGYVQAGPLFPPGDKYWDWRTGWSPKADVYIRPDLT